MSKNTTNNSTPQVIESSAEQWADRIRGELRRTVESIVETGRLLLKTKSDLAHGEWGRMFEERLIPISQDTAGCYMRIAAHPLLSNSDHGRNLPPSWRTLYELTKVPEPTLINAFKDGLITPEMERRHVAALLPPKPAPEPEPFHWLNAIGDLKELIEREIADWPEDARVLVPGALRGLAEALELRNGDSSALPAINIPAINIATATTTADRIVACGFCLARFNKGDAHDCAEKRSWCQEEAV